MQGGCLLAGALLAILAAWRGARLRGPGRVVLECVAWLVVWGLGVRVQYPMFSCEGPAVLFLKL